MNGWTPLPSQRHMLRTRAGWGALFKRICVPKVANAEFFFFLFVKIIEFATMEFSHPYFRDGAVGADTDMHALFV